MCPFQVGGTSASIANLRQLICATHPAPRVREFDRQQLALVFGAKAQGRVEAALAVLAHLRLITPMRKRRQQQQQPPEQQEQEEQEQGGEDGGEAPAPEAPAREPAPAAAAAGGEQADPPGWERANARQVIKGGCVMRAVACCSDGAPVCVRAPCLTCCCLPLLPSALTRRRPATWWSTRAVPWTCLASSPRHCGRRTQPLLPPPLPATATAMTIMTRQQRHRPPALTLLLLLLLVLVASATCCPRCHRAAGVCATRSCGQGHGPTTGRQCT
jgi:hypothetical protein